MTLFYFQKEAYPNCTLMIYLQTNLSLPNADREGNGGGSCFVILSVCLVLQLMELLFIFLIFRGRLMTAEEDCIC